ncbi:MAG: hypothetical protein RIS99_865 [Bacteroidota bacterium]|jgi:putative YhdH/YhfP family quinone oxidoreductase
METYRALWVTETSEGKFERTVCDLPAHQIPDKGTWIKVRYSALNFKDGLSASGHKGITRKFPHTPGVDAVGTVVRCADGQFQEGDVVLVTGYDLGMNTYGGFGQLISVPSEWVIPMPAGMSELEAIVLGTAGFTAALGLYQMELNGQNPEKGALVVSGASGGVGSMAVTIFASAGYEVIASTGKLHESDYLKSLGATSIISREEMLGHETRPMISTRWAGGLDTVGGKTLESMLRATGLYGNVAVCGLVDTPEFSTTVYPLIIRGVNILGVASAETEKPIRLKVWEKLAGPWKPKTLDLIHQKAIGFEELNASLDDILGGRTRGRVVLDLWK